jgi:hypothetical protein
MNVGSKAQSDSLYGIVSRHGFEVFPDEPGGRPWVELRIRSSERSVMVNLKSVVGQSRRFRDVRVASAYAPRAATKRTWKHFAFVPGSDICIAANSTTFDHLVGTRIACGVPPLLHPAWRTLPDANNSARKLPAEGQNQQWLTSLLCGRALV